MQRGSAAPRLVFSFFLPLLWQTPRTQRHTRGRPGGVALRRLRGKKGEKKTRTRAGLYRTPTTRVLQPAACHSGGQRQPLTPHGVRQSVKKPKNTRRQTRLSRTRQRRRTERKAKKKQRKERTQGRAPASCDTTQSASRGPATSPPLSRGEHKQMETRKKKRIKEKRDLTWGGGKGVYIPMSLCTLHEFNSTQTGTPTHTNWTCTSVF